MKQRTLFVRLCYGKYIEQNKNTEGINLLVNSFIFTVQQSCSIRENKAAQVIIEYPNRSVFKTLSNIYGGAILRKLESYFCKQTPS